ncbi:hypothetical protein CR513_43404, partial [Mucuna pruriens]
MLPLEDCSDVEVAKPIDEVVLVTRHALSIQPKEYRDMEQREHIFYTRCLVQEKVCSMIIDGGSCTNVASIILVEKLNLKNVKHPIDIGKVKVDKQVLVSFAIGKYKDEVLYDVVTMEAGHILLGREPHGYSNHFSFIYNELKITLAPLTPKQVFEDQIKIRKVRDCEKSK